MAQVLTTELTALLRHVALWTDSITVLTWLQSDTCRFKSLCRDSGGGDTGADRLGSLEIC